MRSLAMDLSVGLGMTGSVLFLLELFNNGFGATSYIPLMLTASVALSIASHIGRPKNKSYPLIERLLLFLKPLRSFDSTTHDFAPRQPSEQWVRCWTA